MPYKLNKRWEYAVKTAIVLPVVLAEIPRFHSIKVDSLETAMVLAYIRISLYFTTLVVIGLVCLFFPRAVYESQRQEAMWERKLPLLSRLYRKEMPEDPTLLHMWSSRIIGTIFIAVAIFFFWNMFLVN